MKKNAKNPYAIGMSIAKKLKKDEPPLEKSTIVKAHDIAKGIMKGDKKPAKSKKKVKKLKEAGATLRKYIPGLGKMQAASRASSKEHAANFVRSAVPNPDQDSLVRKYERNAQRYRKLVANESQLNELSPEKYGHVSTAAKNRIVDLKRALASAEKIGDKESAKRYADAIAHYEGLANKTSEKHATGISQRKLGIAKSRGTKLLPSRLRQTVTTEAERPLDGDQLGPGSHSGRGNVLESKTKKRINENMNTCEAAYHEGKSHGLSKHNYACKYNEGSEEHRRYHRGYIEGLDECYGLQPNRGLVDETVDDMTETASYMDDNDLPEITDDDLVDDMASYGAHDDDMLDEMDDNDSTDDLAFVKDHGFSLISSNPNLIIAKINTPEQARAAVARYNARWCTKFAKLYIERGLYLIVANGKAYQVATGGFYRPVVFNSSDNPATAQELDLLRSFDEYRDFERNILNNSQRTELDEMDDNDSTDDLAFVKDHGFSLISSNPNLIIAKINTPEQARAAVARYNARWCTKFAKLYIERGLYLIVANGKAYQVATGGFYRPVVFNSSDNPATAQELDLLRSFDEYRDFERNILNNSQRTELDEVGRGEWMRQKDREAEKAGKGSFSAFGQTFNTADIDEAFTFESLERQLNALLKEDAGVTEGLSVSMSQGLSGLNGQGNDTVSVTATDDDASKLLGFMKQVGLGGFGDEKSGDQPSAIVSVSDYGAPAYNGHDDMKNMMIKMSGEDYEEESEEGEQHHHQPEVCTECGMNETKCQCDEEVVETETQDQETEQVAEDDGEGYEQGQEAEAQIDSALAVGSENEEQVDEMFFFPDKRTRDQKSRDQNKPADVLGNRPKHGIAKHGNEYKDIVKGKNQAGEELPQDYRDRFKLGKPKGELPESQVDEMFFFPDKRTRDQKSRDQNKPADVLGNRPKHGIAKHGNEYKDIVKGKNQAGEELPQDYRDRFKLGKPKGELPESQDKESAMKDPNSAVDYAINVLRARWPEAEKVIATDSKARERYERVVLKGKMSDSKKPSEEEAALNEWANEAGKDGTEASFQRDIDFMTKVISGGLNKPKSTGQQTIPVLAQDKKRTVDHLDEWMKLSGVKK